jgi:ABC-type amino acid transport substrate-binding protein
MVLIAQLTATVTSSQTVARLRSEIQGPRDLPGLTIATVPGTAAEAYLKQRGLPHVAMTDTDEGIGKLMRGEVQAIVFDSPTLQYWAGKHGDGSLQVVGPVFQPEKYGIAVAQGSPLRKRIDAALLAMYADGTYEAIHARWFARGG